MPREFQTGGGEMLRGLCALLGCALGASALAADTISATHVFPASLIYSRSFLEYVKKANEAGKGVFAIQVRGGPEAIGMMEQPGAVRSGVVDMVYTPCAFYAAAVPECDAVSASTVDGPTARKNGGIDFLNQIHQKRMGVVLLGWVDSGIRFNLWSTKEPKLDATGHIDIKGFKVRGNPIYNAFLTNYLGAQVINLPSTELYTALERGTVDLTAWTQIGLMDLNWDRYIRYRILPDFFETDLMILVNQKKWSSLSPKTREILQRVAIEHETSSLKALQALWKKEEAELKKRGIKTIAQSPDAAKRFTAGARAASLQRMKERMEKSGGVENYDKIVKLFTPG
jgi:TRAP-type C4-dicarboxylate transport system substrate-binding protein